MNASPQKTTNQKLTLVELLTLIFFAGRLLFFFALMPNDIHGLGDFPNYYSVSILPGFPYFAYWTEYPPIFAFSIKLISLLSLGNQTLFDFILYLVVTISGSISIFVLSKIAENLDISRTDNKLISLTYFGFLAFISYSWWYFDLVIVVIMLIVILNVIIKRESSAGILLGIGILTKWFPILLLPAIFLFSKKRSAVKILILSFSLVIFVWSFLLISSPEMSWASLKSQPGRNSWQTIWALIDGNMVTGAFIPLENRYDPSLVNQSFGNPATIPTWLTFLVFFGIGLFLMFKIKHLDKSTLINFSGITWVLFLLWSPGWSPQWILYLVPFILLTFPLKPGLLLTFGLSLISLLEWPVFLGRQIFEALWFLVACRIFIFSYLLYFWTNSIYLTARIKSKKII